MKPDFTDMIGFTDAVFMAANRLIPNEKQPVAVGKVINAPGIVMQMFHDFFRHGNRAEAVQCFRGCGFVCAPWKRFIYLDDIFTEINI